MVRLLGTPNTKLFVNKKNTLQIHPNNRESAKKFLLGLKQTYNLNSPEDWNLITYNHVQSNGGDSLLATYSMYELKCMACPEGKSMFNNTPHLSSPRPPGYWKKQDNIDQFLSKIKEKYNLNTPKDWNSITKKFIQSNGGGTLLNIHTMFDIKCMACPEGKLMFKNPKQISGYWENKENIEHFLSKIKEKYNLNTPEDWNSITTKHIQSNGGGALLNIYSIYEIKCMACPNGKSAFNDANKSPGYWENKENIDKFLSKIKEKYNLNTPEDWNMITRVHIKSNRGSALLNKYSLFDLKCMACPEGKLMFENSATKQVSGYWENKENIEKFLSQIKEKYKFNTPEDWNSITKKQIQSNGGGTLLNIHTMFDIKCMACPEGKLMFKNPKQVSGYWENRENIDKFLSDIKYKYNLNAPEDWNSITRKDIQINGGRTLLSKYSIYEIKCMACPEGKPIFNNPSGYWEKQENIHKFLTEIKEKYNLNTPEDWNSITTKQIKSNGGGTLLSKYSMFEIKCMACPEGKLMFKNPPQVSGYWENKENIDKFLSDVKEKYNLNTPEDWQRISKHQLAAQGGWELFNSKNINTNVKFEMENKTIKYIPLSTLISGSNYKRASQRWLFLQIQKLFPHEEIVEDYFHSEISRISGFNVQFDIFMIERNIAIEYHGRHHYEDVPKAFSNLETYKHRDLEKQKLCEQHGIKLIIIPYWWDNKIDSLKETLYSKIEHK